MVRGDGVGGQEADEAREGGRCTKSKKRGREGLHEQDLAALLLVSTVLTSNDSAYVTQTRAVAHCNLTRPTRPTPETKDRQSTYDIDDEP